MGIAYVSFLFCNPKTGYKKLGGEIIREVEKTAFSHFAVLVCDGYDSTVYESVFPKSRKEAYSTWLDEYDIVNEFIFEVPNRNKMIECVEWLESKMGTWYGVDQIIWIFMCIVFKMNQKIQKDTTLNGSQRLICTELGFTFARKFFDFIWFDDVGQDRVDLVTMFQIANRISNKTTWR